MLFDSGLGLMHVLLGVEAKDFVLSLPTTGIGQVSPSDLGIDKLVQLLNTEISNSGSAVLSTRFTLSPLQTAGAGALEVVTNIRLGNGQGNWADLANKVGNGVQNLGVTEIQNLLEDIFGRIITGGATETIHRVTVQSTFLLNAGLNNLVDSQAFSFFSKINQIAPQ